MLWRAMIPLLFCFSCGDPGYHNSDYGSPQGDAGDLGFTQCTVANGCQAGSTCCGNLCCSQNQVCCDNGSGATSCSSPNLVGDSCGSTSFGP